MQYPPNRAITSAKRVLKIQQRKGHPGRGDWYIKEIEEKKWERDVEVVRRGKVDC